jgi:hypothetical protein
MTDDVERDITYEVSYRVTTYHRAHVTITHAEDVARPSTADAVRAAVTDRDDLVIYRTVHLDTFTEER